MTYTNRFCVAMLAAFATYNPSEAVLTECLRIQLVFSGTLRTGKSEMHIHVG